MTSFKKTSRHLSTFLIPLMGTLLIASAPARAATLEERVDAQAVNSLNLLRQNLDSDGILPGAVIASPSRANPDYFFHWVRDAALVMNTWVNLYEKSSDAAEKAEILERLTRWIRFEIKLQSTPNRSGGLGEPKFNVNATAFEGDWGRPQNDGPALRSVMMARIALALVREGKTDWVRRELYSSSSSSPIKRDLEYVAHHWKEASFDLWEEVKGMHFYTLMVQRRSMLIGAELASALDDGGAADFYRQQARAMEAAISKHRNSGKGYIEATLNGGGNKQSGLDVAVILGSLHGATGSDSFFAPSDDWVLSTAHRLEQSFQSIYSINQQHPTLATAIGRYPEDVYNGNGFGEGSPWFLATQAYAELYCKAAQSFESQGQIQLTPLKAKLLNQLTGSREFRADTRLSARTVTFKKAVKALRAHGLSYLERSLFHMGAGGRMSEQFNRHSGFMQGARDLSWSYASFITARDACLGD